MISAFSLGQGSRKMKLILHLHLKLKAKNYWKGIHSFINLYIVPGLVFDY